MALCGATMSTMPLWAATEWEDPEVQTTTVDLETGGTYFVYHPATNMFMINGNDANTQLSFGETGLKINIQKAEDPRFGVNGWTLEMPDAPSNNAGKPNYIFVIGDGSRAYVDYNMGATDHFVWKIVKNADSDTYRIKMPDEDPVFGVEAQDGMYANAYMGWDGILNENGGMQSTAVMPLVDPKTSGYENAQLDWAFVTVDEYEKFVARKELKKTLEYAVEKGFTDYSQYEEIYNQGTATADEINKASVELSAAIEAFLLAGASETNPVDLTNRISQPSFDTGTDGWVAEKVNSPDTGWDNLQRQTSTQPTTDGTVFQNFFERWVANPPQTDWSVTQQINGLPQGKYKLTAYVLTNSDTPEGLYVVADGGLGEERTEATEPGNINGIVTARPYDVEFTVLDNTATIGFRAINTNCQWSGVDNFKLTYYGKSEVTVRDGLQMTIDEVSAYLQQLIDNQVKCSNKGKEKLTSTLALAEQAMVNESIDDDSILVIRQTLIDCKDEMKNDVEVYGQIMDVVDTKLDQLINNYEPYLELSDNPEAFVNIYGCTDALEDAYNDGTFDPAEFDSVGYQIDEAFRKDIYEMVNNGLTTDLYGLLQSPNFDNNSSSGWMGEPSVDIGVAEKYFGSDGIHSFDVYQEIEGIPNGVYTVSMQGYCRPGNNDVLIAGWDDGQTNTVYSRLYGNDDEVAVLHLYDGGRTEPYIMNEDGSTNDIQISVIDNKYVVDSRTEADIAFKAGEYQNEVRCVVSDGKLRFGVKRDAVAGLAGNWTTMDNFRVVYEGEAKAEDYVASIERLYNEMNGLYASISSYEVIATADVLDKFTEFLGLANAFITAPTTTEEAQTLVVEMKEAMDYADLSMEKTNALNVLVDEMYNNRCMELESTIPGIDLGLVYDICDEISALLPVNQIESVEKVEEYVAQLNSALTKTVQDMLSAGATKDEPKDLTALIVNPDFTVFDEDAGIEVNTGEGWTKEKDGGNDSANYSEYEFWNSNSFNFYQTIYGLAPGFYKLQCNGYYCAGGSIIAAASHRDGTEELNALLYAGPDDSWTYEPLMSIIEGGTAEPYASSNVNVADSLTTEENPIDAWYVPGSMEDAQNAFARGAYMNELSFEVKEGQDKINLGIRKFNYIDQDWVVFDAFRLSYLGKGDENRPDGIQTSEKGSELVVRTVYYNINGIPVLRPVTSGLYIRKDELSDGTVKVSKIIVK